MQAGAPAEHGIGGIRHTAAGSGWTGDDTDYVHTDPVVRSVSVAADGGPWLDVVLPPGTRTTLTLELALRAFPPSYRRPARSGGLE